MAPQSSAQERGPSFSGVKFKRLGRVHKRKTPTIKSLKRRDGLLNTTISSSSNLLEIAQRNSLESPLLCLPGEIREAIWKHALGGHQVEIPDVSQEGPVEGIYDMRTLYPDTLCPPGSARPTFQLPRVCRQMYVEASPYVYSMNTFAFHSMAALDQWIKNRCVGQRRLIASLNIPRTYARLYRCGLRRDFRLKFSNISRIGIDNWTLFCDYDEIRRLPENKGKLALDMWVEAKAKIVAEIHMREGKNVRVDWHGQST